MDDLEAFFGLQDAVEEPDDLETLFGLDDGAVDDSATSSLEALFGLDASGEDPQRRTHPLPEGVAPWSSAHMQLAAKRRWDKSAAKTTVAERYDRLADAWDLLPLRAGDKAIREERSPHWTHPNTYELEGLVRNAFREVGGGISSARGEVAFDQSRHQLEVVAVI